MMIKRLTLLCVLSGMLCVSCSKKSETPKPDEPAPAAEITEPAKSDNAPKTDDTDENRESEGNAALAPEDEKPAARGARSPGWHGYSPVEAKAPGLGRNPLLRDIPGSSFLIIASSGEFDYQRKDFDDFIHHISNLAMAQLKQIQPEASLPFEKSMHALFHGIFKNLSSAKLKSLGLSGETLGHFALYFVRQTPVLKVSLSDAAKFKDIVESYWNQNGIKARTPNDIKGSWSLLKLSDDMPVELAVRWDMYSLTVTIVSDDDHAGKLLPDLSTQPQDGKTAADQLASIKTEDSTYIVGQLDMNSMLNQFVQIQEQTKKFIGEQELDIDKRCVKDLHRIAGVVPRITLEASPVSGGMVLGVDAKLSFELQNSGWMKDLLDVTPQKAAFPKAPVMPLANFWFSLPVKQLMGVLGMYRDAVKHEPFTCPWLKDLNDVDAEAISEMTAIPQFAEHSHYAGAVLYEGTVETPRKYAAFYRSDKAAEMAVLMHLLKSPTLEKALGTAGDAGFVVPSEDAPADAEKPADEGEKPADAEKPTAEGEKQADAEKPAAEGEKQVDAEKPADEGVAAVAEGEKAADDAQAAAPIVYEDAQIAFGSFPASVKVKAHANAVTLASDGDLLGQMAESSFKPSDSLVHLEWSERLLEDKDADPDHDYHKGVDILVKPGAVEVRLRYALE